MVDEDIFYNEDELYHYGTPRHSGRYPWGSGEHPYQSLDGFYGTVRQYKKEGMSEKEIADAMDLSVRQLRAKYSNAKNEVRAANVAEAWRLKDKGYSNTAIGKRMGVNESTVRSWLDPGISEKNSIATNTANMLKSSLGDQPYLDIGGGVENHLGITRTALDNAIDMLQDQGYKIHYIREEQPGTGKMTSIKVLAGPESTYSEVYKNRESISMPGFRSEDGGRTIDTIKAPVSISSNRIQVRYNEDGGIEKDGVIELRRGVNDISLGNASYAQVRIAVDGTHYLKGMAVYSDNMPDGVDVIFNTNKSKGTPLKGHKDNSVLKEMKSDPDNPFGATIKAQRYFTDTDGKRQQSAINIVNEQGDWNTWRKTLSSQMLSKQSPALAKQQLKLAYDLKLDEYSDISNLTNPTLKKQLLAKMADECDSAAVHLKAAGLPRQASKVILPITSLKDNEIYAPSYRNGEEVVLVRYPHGGTFEIPRLKVNNGNKEGKSTLGNAIDAVGINSKVAERLSGADFDGDTVLVIPTAGAKITSTNPLKGLKNFDPKIQYKAYPGMTEVKGSGFNKQREMGDVSNLITDMTIKGAPPEHIAAAVRHSMVIIDAEKHNLNYKQSYIDNNIANLKATYQGSAKAGASTLISKASSQANPLARKEITNVKNMTEAEKERYLSGKKVYRETGESYLKRKQVVVTSDMTEAERKAYFSDKKKVKSTIAVDVSDLSESERKLYSQGKKVYRETGKPIMRTTTSTKMAEADDARTLSSGTTIETIYAEHANKLKGLAAQCRREAYSTKPIVYSSEARKTYSTEYESLKGKINEAMKNRPLERKAILIANAKVKAVRTANPDMDKDDIKKLKGRALSEARLKTGAKKQSIILSDKEWEAIQAGAISNSMLEKIIDNADLDALKKRAMPRETKVISSAKRARAKTLYRSGYTLAEIADAIGVSVSSIEEIIRE